MSKRFRKPTAIELREYADHLGFNAFDPQAFLAHYESNGWMVGRVKMKNWKATVVTWKRNHAKFDGGSKTAPRMSYKTRQEKINELNRRKAQLIRQPPSRKRDWQLEQIRTQLIDL